MPAAGNVTWTVLPELVPGTGLLALPEVVLDGEVPARRGCDEKLPLNVTFCPTLMVMHLGLYPSEGLPACPPKFTERSADEADLSTNMSEVQPFRVPWVLSLVDDEPQPFTATHNNANKNPEHPSAVLAIVTTAS